MISRISARRLSTTAATFAAVSLLIAFNAGNALGGGLLGGVGNAAGGALGGIGSAVGGALGGGGAPESGASTGTASTDGTGVGAQAAQSPVIRKKRLKRGVVVDDAEPCRNTLFDRLWGHDCYPRRTAAEEAYQDDIEPKKTKKARQVEQPVKKKATAPKSIARLNVEEPKLDKPKPTVGPKLIKPKAVEKAEPEPDATLSCDKAGSIVGGYGFIAINPADCEGRVYAFNASRDGKAFTVTLNAASGELIEVRKVP
jgi:hypothetical protein